MKLFNLLNLGRQFLSQMETDLNLCQHFRHQCFRIKTRNQTLSHGFRFESPVHITLLFKI